MIKPETCYSNNGNEEVLIAIPSSAGKILDLGCGAGNMAKHSAGSGVIWDGITISPDEAERGRPYYRNILLHDLERGLPVEGMAKNYDVCICSHVIEHIVWPQKLLAGIRSVLEPLKGILIVAVPNFVNHEVRMKILRGKFEYRPSGILDINHVRWYTLESAKRLLAENGFTVTKSWAEGKFPLGRGMRKKLSPSILGNVDRMACKWFPGLFGYQLLYRAEPDWATDAGGTDPVS
jgi:SAM-dependent methyltransferase